MSDNLKFLILIVGITFFLLVLSVAVVGKFGNSRMVQGVIYGYLVSLINILFSFFSIKWAFNKANRTFLSVMLGGMGIRIVILFAALFYVRSLPHVHLIAFTFSLIGFYLTLQFFEIKYIQSELGNKKATT